MIEPPRLLRRLGEGVGEQRRQPQRCQRVGLQRAPQGVVVESGQRLDRRDRERVVDQAVDPAVLRERGVDQCLTGGLVVDVGWYDERPASVGADDVGHRVEPLLRARGEHQVGSLPAASSPSARPSPGPTPESTTTLSCSSPPPVQPIDSVASVASVAEVLTSPTGQFGLLVQRREGSSACRYVAERAILQRTWPGIARSRLEAHGKCPVGVLETTGSARSACWRRGCPLAT